MDTLAGPLAAERLGGARRTCSRWTTRIERVLAAFAPLEEHERVSILDALGRVIVEDVPADIDIPPFDNYGDGRLRRAGGGRGPGDGGAPGDAPPVLGEVAAGQVASRPIGPGEGYRILTGAPLPPGADTIVPYEYTDGQGFGGWRAGGGRGGRPWPSARYASSGRWRTADNTRHAGEDQRRGEVVLRAGTLVRPAEVGVLASLGRTRVWVHRRPRVAVLSTGDEVVPVDQPLGPGQIRNANSWSLLALIRHYGGEPIDLGIAPDRPEAVRERLLDGVARGADLLLTSGGVSMGDRDVVKGVLQEEGEIAFWSIDLRPGKPLAFGRLRGVPDHGATRQSRLLDGDLRAVRPPGPAPAGRAAPAAQGGGWRRWRCSRSPTAAGRENFMRGRAQPASGHRRRGDAVAGAPDRGAGLGHPDLDGPGERPGAGAEDPAADRSGGAGDRLAPGLAPARVGVALVELSVSPAGGPIDVAPRNSGRDAPDTATGPG